jgi:hypothetical protein
MALPIFYVFPKSPLKSCIREAELWLCYSPLTSLQWLPCPQNSLRTLRMCSRCSPTCIFHMQEASSFLIQLALFKSPKHAPHCPVSGPHSCEGFCRWPLWPHCLWWSHPCWKVPFQDHLSCEVFTLHSLIFMALCLSLS